MHQEFFVKYQLFTWQTESSFDSDSYFRHALIYVLYWQMEFMYVCQETKSSKDTNDVIFILTITSKCLENTDISR
jgi:hypothetical protein